MNRKTSLFNVFMKKSGVKFKTEFFSIMIDDTSDISNIEKSAISIRIINDGTFEEHLLGLVNASGDQTADG